MVEIRYIGPMSGVYLPGLEVNVPRGGTIKVSTALAGRAPSGKDPGEGFLAQVANWEKVSGGDEE